MNIPGFLRASTPILLILALFFSAATLVAHIPVPMPSWLAAVLDQLDLNRWGCNLGALFQGSLFLFCSLSFVPLGWGPAAKNQTGRAARWLWRLAAIGCCFLALEEIFLFHKALSRIIEDTIGLSKMIPMLGHGHAWLPVFAVAALAGLILFVLSYWKQIGAIENTVRLRSQARTLLIVALAALGVDILCEAGEAFMKHLGSSHTLFGWLEETVEMVCVLSFLGCNTCIAEGQRL